MRQGKPLKPMILDAEYIALKNNVIKVGQLHSFCSDEPHLDLLKLFIVNRNPILFHIQFCSVVDPDSALVSIRIRIQIFKDQKC